MAYMGLSGLLVATALTMAGSGLSQVRAGDYEIWRKNLGSPSSKQSGKAQQGKNQPAVNRWILKNAWPSKIEASPRKTRRSR